MSAIWSELRRQVTNRPRTVALQDADRAVCYGQLFDEVDRRVVALKEQRTVTLGLALPNSVEWVLWDLAARKAGVVCVPIPPFFSQPQVQHLVADAGIDTMLLSDGLKKISVPVEGHRSLVCKITYTSGSTGTPRGVCLTEAGIDQVALSLIEMLGTEFARNHLSVMPLAVLLENVAGVYPALMIGSTVHLGDCAAFHREPGTLLTALNETRASSAILVPELLRGMVPLVRKNRTPLNDLRFVAVGGARVSTGLITDARSIGLPVYEGYGLSECASVVSLNTPEHDRAGSAGKLLPHIKARVVCGELLIDNPSASGYLGGDSFTVLHTGDCGSIDNDGYLSISGRKKNTLITSWGRNIQPEWVETVLLDQPAILQSMIIGEGRSSLGALVVAAPGGCAKSAAIALRTANRQLPEYAQVKRFRMVEPFTCANKQLTGNGRIVRSAILKLHTQGNHHEDIIL